MEDDTQWNEEKRKQEEGKKVRQEQEVHEDRLAEEKQQEGKR